MLSFDIKLVYVLLSDSVSVSVCCSKHGSCRPSHIFFKGNAW